MEAMLVQLREEWARKKKHYEDLLYQYFPPDTDARGTPWRPLPVEVRAELERREKEAEDARLAYLSYLLQPER